MAEPYLKNGRYYGRVKDGSGRWRDIALVAATKTEARRLSGELESKYARQRLGLEAMPIVCEDDVAQLCAWWVSTRCKARSRSKAASHLDNQVGRTWLGAIKVRGLDASHVERRLAEMEAEGYSASYVDGVRRLLHAVFAHAITHRRCAGPNPIDEVVTRVIPKRLAITLRAEQVPIVLANVTEDWRDLMATVVHTGLRKGEVFGLQRRDVDLEHDVLMVVRSYDHATTKGGEVVGIPIAAALRPYLVHALAAAGTSAYVFPARSGAMRSVGLHPEKVLRSALARAGLVRGYKHTCRRCAARATPHIEQHPDAALRRCPTCGMKLWPRAVPIPMRFHDLRHTTATLLLRAGVDAHRVQRILRHKDLRTTLDIYGHLVVDDLRDAVEQVAPARAAVVAIAPDAGTSCMSNVPTAVQTDGPKASAGYDDLFVNDGAELPGWWISFTVSGCES